MMETTMRLTKDEDAMLRRLHFFEANGAILAAAFAELKAALRARDLRTEIREPFELLAA